MGEPIQPALRVARGASYLVLQGVVVNILGVVFFAFATRILPTIADFGRFTTLNIFVILIVIAGSLGLPTAGTRFIAKYIAAGQSNEARGVYRTVLGLGAGLSAVSLVATIVASNSISLALLGSPEYGFLVELAAVDIFFQLLTLFPLGALQGAYLFRDTAFVNIVSNIVQFSTALYFLSVGMGLVGILFGWILGDGLGSVLALAVAWRVFSFSGPLEPLGGIIRFSTPLYGANLVGYVSTYIDRYLVLFFAGSAALGIYSPAVTAAGILGVLSGGIATALLPQLTELYARQGGVGLRDATRMASRYLSIFFLPLATGLAALAAPTLTVLAGARYGDGAIPLAILSLAWGLTLSSVAINTALLASGMTSTLLYASFLGILGDLAFAPLIGPLGVIGAAFARVILMGVSLVYSWLAIRTRLPNVVDLGAFWKVLVCALVEGGFVLTVELPWYDRHLLSLYVFVGATVYLLSLRVVKVVRSEDIALLRRFVPTRFGFLVSIFSWLVGYG